MTKIKSIKWYLGDAQELENKSNQQLDTLDASELIEFVRFSHDEIEDPFEDPDFKSAVASHIMEKAKEGEIEGRIKFKTQNILQI